ncbi:MAG: signal peptidase I [Acidobacteriota bacterium]
MAARSGIRAQREAKIEILPPRKSVVRDYFETIVICVIFVLFSRAFVFQQSKIPTGSMEDTLLIGDYIMVNRFVYSPTSFDFEKKILPMRDVKRQDVIVFKFPEEPEFDYIKRVIGLPGDIVEVRDGIAFVNGEKLNEPYIADRYRDPHSYFPPTVVPPDSYFVLGDHRNNSRDSRYFGFVPRSFIKGRAFIIWWSYQEDRDDYERKGFERIKSILSKLFHLFTKSRWDRCFTIIK